jgi:hypothetical protein
MAFLGVRRPPNVDRGTLGLSAFLDLDHCGRVSKFEDPPWLGFRREYSLRNMDRAAIGEAG